MRYIQPIHGCPYSEGCQNDLCRYDDACQSDIGHHDRCHDLPMQNGRCHDTMCRNDKCQFNGMCQYSERSLSRCLNDSICSSGRSESKDDLVGGSRICLEVSRVMLSENCTVTDRYG